MKKTCFILLLTLACTAWACNNSNAKPPVNPVDQPTDPAEGEVIPQQGSPKGCDMAFFEGGKVTFYQSASNTLIPYEVEKDSVVDGVFWNDNCFFYTVAIGQDLYLKRVRLDASSPAPETLTDWGLKLNDCFAESCTKAPMRSYSNIPLIEMYFDLYEEYCEFTQNRYYNFDTQQRTDSWPEDINVGDAGDEMELDLLNDQDWFKTVEVEVEVQSEDEEGYKNYYYYVPDPSGDPQICLSDQIDFDQYKGEYSYEPNFELLGVSPNRDAVVFGAPIDWGHVGHGPLCFATLDGKVQKVLVSDYADAFYGWLIDGRLAYVDVDGVKIVALDGTEMLVSKAQKIVTLR